jgi:exosortase/archaeosortase family protein
MRSRAVAALGAPVAVLAAVLGAFALLDGPVRGVESGAAVGLLHVLGVPATAVQVRAPSGIAVFPAGAAPFLAVVTPSCSALGSLLALVLLGLFVPARYRLRRPVALACALALVAAGNVVRIAASVAVGLAVGTGSLVLFHDWVGSLFAFAYTLGGYLLMLFLLLPRRSAEAGHEPAGRWHVDVG